MIIKRITANADTPITLDDMMIAPTIKSTGKDYLLDIQASEQSADIDHFTDYLQPFIDPKYFNVAYAHGYRTMMSMSKYTGSNEIIYIIKV